MELNTPPIKEPFMGLRGAIAQVWATWFQQCYKILLAVNPSISTDNGDADVTLTVGKKAITQRFATPLSQARTVTLSTTGAFSGARFHITREAGATGAFNLEVAALKSLTAAGQWAEVEYSPDDGWILTAYGSL